MVIESEIQSHLVHVSADAETFIVEVEKELMKLGDIVSQAYLRGPDLYDRLVIMSANYTIMISKERSREFFETCRSLNKEGLTVKTH